MSDGVFLSPKIYWRRSFHAFEWLVDGGYVVGLEVQPLYPIFGTQAGKMMLDLAYARGEAQRLGFTIHNEDLLRTLRGKYLGSDSPDTDNISREWADIFTDVEYDKLVAVAEQMNTYATKHSVASGSVVLRKTEKS